MKKFKEILSLTEIFDDHRRINADTVGVRDPIILQCIFFYTEEIKWKAKFHISNHAVKMIIKRI